MKTHAPCKLKDAVTSIFWLPFDAGGQLKLSDDCTIEFNRSRHLPVFLSGEDQEAYKETSKVAITAHSILMGALVGFSQDLVVIPHPEQEREFLANIIRQLVNRYFKVDDMGAFLLGAAHWLRENVGIACGRAAMKTALHIVPTNTPLKADCIIMTWFLAEKSEKGEKAALLEEILRIYRETPVTEMPVPLAEMISYQFCAAFGLLGGDTRGANSMEFRRAMRHIHHPCLRGKLQESQALGFSMERCRLGVEG